MSDSKEQPNPYDYRDHENSAPMGRDDVLAVAGLFGQVAGSLSEIDKNNVGGESLNIKARKLDPKTALKKYTNAATSQQLPGSSPQPVAVPMAPPGAQQHMQPVHQVVPQQHIVTETDLERRVVELEKIVETYRSIVKFKRGISYNITTSKISGTFKDMSTILDIVTTELAKQTKSITLKLNDNTKN